LSKLQYSVCDVFAYNSHANRRRIGTLRREQYNSKSQRPPTAERWLRQCSNAGRRSSSAGMPTSWSQARGAIVGAVRAAAVKHLAACESVSAQVPLQAPLSKTISTSYDAIRHDYATDNARSESGPASSLVYRIHGCQQQDVSHRKQIARQHSSR